MFKLFRIMFLIKQNIIWNPLRIKLFMRKWARSRTAYLKSIQGSDS
ncbi:MAG: hypothetical protein ACTSPQ_22170 [Candidatus Helarchaeota archaeon]